MPKDVTAAVLKKAIAGGIKSSIPGKKAVTPQTSVPSEKTMENIKRVADAINKAHKPILYVGQGMLATPDGPKILKRLVEEGNIPVTTTLQGLGAFDEEHSHSLHMLGMHGSAYANLAMQTADVIVALGARFDDRVTGNLTKFAPAAKRAALSRKGGIFHFDIMPKNIDKVVQSNIAIEGDAATNVEAMMPFIKHQPRKLWFDQLDEWKQKYPFTFTPSENGAALKPQEIIQELNNQTKDIKDKVIISTGVGQHQMWACQFYRWRQPRTWISSGGLGTMGFGLPAAIGAKVACPDKIVIDIDGDASLSMTAMELMTARQFDINVKVLLLNNDFQGMVCYIVLGMCLPNLSRLNNGRISFTTRDTLELKCVTLILLNLLNLWDASDSV